MTTQLSQERRDLLEALHAHRGFLRQTVEGLDEEQARRRSTVSALNLGGLIKHVAAVEAQWLEFALRGTDAFDMSAWADIDWSDPEVLASDPRHDEFNLVAGETVAEVLADYDRVAARTDEMVATADLDVAYPLPDAPWFPKGTTRSVRRTVVHIIAETAQHAGHADIIREAIDGAKTMG